MRRSTSIDFAENQLFPSLIGLSPLATAHPRLFQQAWVRPPVGVTPPSAWPWLDHSVSGLPPATERPVQTRFRSAYAYRLKLAANGNSLTHYTKGTPSRHPYLRISAAPTACRHSVSGLFHSPHRGAFHLSLTVLVHYRS